MLDYPSMSKRKATPAVNALVLELYPTTGAKETSIKNDIVNYAGTISTKDVRPERSYTSFTKEVHLTERFGDIHKLRHTKTLL